MDFLTRAPRALSARRISTQRRWPRCFCERATLRFRFRKRTHAINTTRDECDTATTTALLLLLRTVHAPGGHRARMYNKQCSKLPCYSRVYVYLARLRLSRCAPLECSVPTAGDGELGRAALPRGDQSRRRIHRGGFPRRRATSLPRNAVLGQSWQARR